MMIKVHISRLLGERRLNVKEAAEICGIHYNTLLRIYNEETKGMDYGVMSKLCSGLNVNITDFLEYIPDEKAS